MKKNPNLALLVRGLIWALPTLCIVYWEPRVLNTLAMVFALPLGALIVAHLPRQKMDKFALSSALRGGIFGLLIAASQFPGTAFAL